MVDDRIVQLLTDRNYAQYVSQSTRKENGNILDLVIARPGLIIANTVHIDEVGYSDHNLLTFNVNISSPPARVVSFSFRDIRNMLMFSLKSLVIQQFTYPRQNMLMSIVISSDMMLQIH